MIAWLFYPIRFLLAFAILTVGVTAVTLLALHLYLNALLGEHFNDNRDRSTKE